ncbi:MAG: hypothetical protein NVSMB56_13450 [Pyrinomonadaceae bacterium]
MAGLLNIVPRYLPRYGMAPEWVRAVRPLTIVFTVISFAVTIVFRADVDAQGGAYATGVLVLMSSAAIAVALSSWRRQQAAWMRWAFVVIALVFAYTTIVNIFERPEGIKIASIFIGTIIALSFISRIVRTTELRVEGIELDETAQAIVNEAEEGTIRIIASQYCPTDTLRDYRAEEKLNRETNHMPPTDPIIFFEVETGDTSEFSGVLRVKGIDVGGNYRVLRTTSSVVPNVIAAFLLYLRDYTGRIPHVYFQWSDRNPLGLIFSYVLFGEGDIAPITHEVLRQAEKDRTRRPQVHVGGS